MTAIDWLVVTAASRSQAMTYRRELRRRSRDLPLSRCAHWCVVPDPHGVRVGSGGATLVALRAVARRILRMKKDAGDLRGLLRGERIVVLHCGGDSRRLPTHAATGKIFVPVPDPRTGTVRPLFELILEDLLHAGVPPGGGVLVASGDVYIGLADHIACPGRGIMGVAFPTDAARAAHHGVYIAEPDGHVRTYLQKPDAVELETHAARDGDGHVLIDTGVVSLDYRAAAHWLETAGLEFSHGELKHPGGLLEAVLAGSASLDLYSDMLPSMATPGDPWRGRYRFRVQVIPDSPFLHIGTPRELLATLGDRVVDSHVLSTLDRGEGSVIEACCLETPCRIGRNSILVGVPSGVVDPLVLPDDTGLVCLPIDDDRWTAIAFGIDDSFKSPTPDGETAGDEKRWRLGSISDAITHALRTIADLPGALADTDASSRISFADAVRRTDHRRLHAQREDIRRRHRLQQTPRRLAEDASLPTDAVLADLRDLPEARELAGRIFSELDPQGDVLEHARRLMLLSRLREGFPAAWTERFPADPEREAFRCVARSVRGDSVMDDTPRPATVEHGQLVAATAPARLDFAGGWSDTPPICQAFGGRVVNGAIRLDGRHPLVATARLIPERVLRVSSVDLDRSTVFEDAASIHDHDDPTEWDALAKAALILAGFCPPSESSALTPWLDAVGGGVELTMHSALPKGSGLGSSSILGVSVLACLSRLFGNRPDVESLARQASVLEQMIGAGGGWQDQLGGLVGGVKLLETMPGHDQVPSVDRLRPPNGFTEALNARLLVYFTGAQRLARDILGNVVRRFLLRDPVLIETLGPLRDNAQQTADAIQRGSVDAFAEGVLRYWGHKCVIDPGSSNDEIEAMIGRVRPHLAGWALAGAGGGGFLYMVANDENAATQARRVLEADPPNRSARFFDAEIDSEGLRVELG